MARICTGTSRCSTVATTTGAAGRLAPAPPGAAACTSFLPHAVRATTSKSAIASKRKFLNCLTKLRPMLTSPIASILRRARTLRLRTAHQHPGQPDIGQSAADLLVLEFLKALAPKKLLHPRVIDDHPEKTSCRQQRIHVAELALADTLADVAGQYLVIFSDVGTEETLGKAVILEAAEQ